ncbi:MAG: hypothetical protein ACI9YH_002785 [Colwellia sp.]|jgi:hypothetical protein
MVGDLYVSGDQVHYTKVYETIGSFEIVEAFKYYKIHLSSIEIVHFLVIWTLSNFISKLLLFSLFNTLLSALIIRVFDRLKVNFLVTASFVLSNFYLYVLFFAAERLKFAFIILCLGLSITFIGKVKNGLIAMSVLGHLQMILVIAPMVFQNLIRSLVRSCRNLRLDLSILYIVGAILSLSLVSEGIYTKFQAYYSQNNPEDFFKILIWFVLTLWYTKKTHSSNNVLLIFIPLFCAVYLIGGDRVNMIGYLYFLVPALQYRRGLNLGILISTIYFAGKTIFFIESVVRVGHAFG